MDIAEVKVPKKEAADGNEEEAAVYEEDGERASEEKCPQRLINAIGQSSESVTVESKRKEEEK